MNKLFLFALSLFLFVPALVFSEGEPVPTRDIFLKAKVETVIKETEKQEYGQNFVVQILKLKIQSAEDKGKELELPFELRENKLDQKLKTGDRVIVAKSEKDGEVSYYLSDVYRLPALWYIGLFFFALTVFFAKFQGVRAFLGLAISFGIIGFFIIPFIFKGYDPFWICFAGAIMVVLTSLYVAHGFYLRTHVAFVSILITLCLAAIFSVLFVHLASLFGLGTEDAFFLQVNDMISLNIRGILLGGILIGTLGVLDDVATAQSATVEQIQSASQGLPFRELYDRGLVVGKEHIVSLVNTLVLAYTGASFPLLLLFRLYEKPLWVTLSSEIIAEEVIRMMVGSIAIVFAVPITTALSAFVFSRQKTEGKK